MMHIGLDFDNTIVTYDSLFHKYALAEGLIASDVAMNKQVIRDTIRELPEGNDKWTVLQGVVYGLKMDEAEPADGVEGFLEACHSTNEVELSIISHKTLYPAMGEKVNLREAAMGWIRSRSLMDRFGVQLDHITFVGELEEKLKQISLRGCTHFIDDLPEVLLHPAFPKGVQRILYASNAPEGLPSDVLWLDSWDHIREHFFNG